MNTILQLEVASIRSEAKDVLVLELRDRSGVPLPAFSAGSHLEVNLGNGLIRHYSLYNDPAERGRYCIGVGLAPSSRGGSLRIHDRVRRGDLLSVSQPRNNFPLVPNAEQYCFVAGGIGITPILSMIRWCVAAGKQWQLFYCVRSRQRAAFYEDIKSLGNTAAVHFHIDEEQSGRFFDAESALRAVPATAHVYCCGPAPLMRAVQEAGRDRPSDHVHFEWFSAEPKTQEDLQAFDVVVRSSKQRFRVGADQSILGVLEDNGILLPSACREGLCGTCQVSVLSGIPDHRDTVLSAEQRASNQTMLVCVSRAQSEVLELDL